MELEKTIIPGCFEIQPKLLTDERGVFIKTFHTEVFRVFGLCISWKEMFYTTSKRGVLRGLHFQLPPHDHDKLVFCVSCSVQDVAVDLRIGSPTYGKSLQLTLSAQIGNMIFLPKGLAHGFCTPTEPAVLVYKLSSVYNQKADAGIKWN